MRLKFNAFFTRNPNLFTLSRKYMYIYIYTHMMHYIDQYDKQRNFWSKLDEADIICIITCFSCIVELN